MVELTQAADLLMGGEPQEPAEGRTEPAEPPEQEAVPADGDSDTETTETATPDGQEAEPDREWESWMYDLPIPGLDGMTAGEFKDRAKELQTADEIRAQAENDRITAENEALQARETLKTLVDGMGLQLNDQQIQQAQAMRQQAVAEHERLAVKHIPGWDDAATRAADTEANMALLAEYMITGPEAENAKDWRFQKLVTDYAKLRKRVSNAVKDEAKAKAKQKPKVNRKVTGKADAVADFKAGKMNSQQAATALLLSGRQ